MKAKGTYERPQLTAVSIHSAAFELNVGVSSSPEGWYDEQEWH